MKHFVCMQIFHRHEPRSIKCSDRLKQYSLQKVQTPSENAFVTGTWRSYHLCCRPQGPREQVVVDVEVGRWLVSPLPFLKRRLAEIFLIRLSPLASHSQLGRPRSGYSAAVRGSPNRAYLLLNWVGPKWQTAVVSFDRDGVGRCGLFGITFSGSPLGPEKGGFFCQ